MARVRTLITGVGGSPYYLTGYFEAPGGDPNDYAEAWHQFVGNGITGQTASYPISATLTTEANLQVVDPVSGDVQGFLESEQIVTSGSSTSPMLPPSNQYLVRFTTGVYIDGRQVRGRTYIPCPSLAGATAQGTVSAGDRIALTDRGQALIDDPDSNFVIWSKKNQRWHSAVNADCWSQYAVLRSRRD